MLYYKFVFCIPKLFKTYVKPFNSDYWQNFYDTKSLYKQVFEFFLKNFYCYSVIVVWLFSPSLHPTPAEPTSLPRLHPPPWFCPCVLYSGSCNPLSPLLTYFEISAFSKRNLSWGSQTDLGGTFRSLALSYWLFCPFLYFKFPLWSL